jgi:hypothetical protein
LRLFGGSGKRKGRGLRIVFEVIPNLSSDGQKSFVSITGQQTKLGEYYGSITANFVPNVPARYANLGKATRVLVTARDAKFELNPSDSERFYTDLFYQYYSDVQNVTRQLQQTTSIMFGDIREFGQTITFRPRENSEELVPIFPMREIWSRLYVRDFYEHYGRAYPSELPSLLKTRQNVLSKDDVKLIEQMVIPQKDYRSFISGNAEKIIALKRKVAGGESWEAGFKRDGGQQIRAGIEAAMRSSSDEVIWAPMPLTEGDVGAMTEFTNRMLSSPMLAPL